MAPMPLAEHKALGLGTHTQPECKPRWGPGIKPQTPETHRWPALPKRTASVMSSVQMGLAVKYGWEQGAQGFGGDSSLGAACLEPLSWWPSCPSREEAWPVHVQASANRGATSPLWVPSKCSSWPRRSAPGVRDLPQRRV